MKLFYNIRKKIGYKILHKMINKVQRERGFYNFDTAKTIGIIFNAMHQESYQTVNQFASKLRVKNIKVEGIAYVAEKKQLEYFRPHEFIQFFSIDDSNWHLKSVSACVGDFYDKSYDILLDLNLDNYLTLKYIVVQSQAKLKIGRNISNKMYYDFILDIKEGEDLDYFIEQINRYMKMLKVS